MIEMDIGANLLKLLITAIIVYGAINIIKEVTKTWLTLEYYRVFYLPHTQNKPIPETPEKVYIPEKLSTQKA